MPLRVACLQIDIAFGDPKANFKNVEKQFQALEAHNLDVVVLPELWTTGYDLTRLEEIADRNGSESIHFLSRLAKTHQVNIVGGSIAKQTDQGVTNTMFFFDRTGTVVGEYSKLHLFQLMDEHLYLQHGEKTGLFHLEGTAAAGVICYDIRFPEWIRTHTTKGAEILFVVAEWPLPRLAHWRSLLIARAIENQCYVVAANRAGSDPNNVFAGHSLVIDPWGEIVAETGEDPAVLRAVIDLELVQKVRKQIPIFTDRKPEYYS
ncbi:carbon-nitrogen family hydrolase [Neobacillus sp. SM06]|uniref:carbon-nitrogen family hydrolase n=1 Tax=Neobacillus sp. SM06 TaxID=3422492 RepID=UPI003D2B8B27